MRRNLITIKDKAKKGPFSEGQLRWWTFNAEANGLAGAIVRVGRRVYIDEDRFDDWIDAQNQRQPEAA